MRLLIERVKCASCTIDSKIHSSIDKGFLVYVAFEEGDDSIKIDKAIRKLHGLRIFTDDQGKMNLNLEQVGGKLLIISSFSLFADMSRGNRPTFERSLRFDISKPLYDEFVSKCSKEFDIGCGVFGADMEINAINDGPISVIYDI